MKDSVFELKKSAIPTKKFSLTLPASLLDEVDAIRKTLDEKAPDMNFNVNAICLDALQRAVKTANKELGIMSTKNQTTHINPGDDEHTVSGM